MIKLISVIIVALSISGCAKVPTDNSDASETERSGLKIMTDHLTGCQYLANGNASLAGQPIIPRMDRNGSQVCVEG